MEIIDSRCRPPTPEIKSYFIEETTVPANLTTGARSVSPAYLTGSMDLFMDEMEEAGISKAIVINRNAKAFHPKQNGFIPNNHIHDLMKEYPDKIVGVAGIDLANEVHDPIEETERCVALGFKSVHIEPGRSLGCFNNDERIFPLYEKCIDLDIPIVLMTGPLAGPNQEFTNPKYIEEVALRYRELKIICGHGCWPFVTQILGVCFRCPNVYLIPDAYLYMPAADQYIQAANTFLRDRILFGSAYPYRPLGQTVEDFRALPIDPYAMEKVAAKNARKVFKLE